MSDELHRRLLREVELHLRRNDVEAWMRANRREMEQLLAGGHMDWQQAAEHFERAGLYVDGKLPTAESTEAAWRRVTAAR